MAGADFNVEIRALQDDSGKEIVSTLSSETTLQVFNLVQEEPRTPADIADVLDMSTQNVHYHIRKAREAGLIEWNEVEYSEKGLEMKVYEPAVDNLVICNDQETKRHLEKLLKRLAGGISIAAGLSAMLHVILMQLFPPTSTTTPENPDTPVAIHTMEWWQYPSVWVFTISVFLVCSYSLWRHRRERISSP